MREAFTSILAAWMLIVGVSGWCCHPVARFATSLDVVSTASVAATTHECCRRCGGTEHEESDASKPSQDAPNPCDGQRSCYGVCVYIPSPEVDRITLDLTFAMLIPEPVFSQFAGVHGQLLTCDQQHIQRTEALYLLHQVFRI